MKKLNKPFEQLSRYIKHLSPKALLQFGLIILISNAFIACSKKPADVSTTSKVPPTSEVSPAESTTVKQPAVLDNSIIDLDLTQMSATMIYSTIFNMLIMPEEYVEKNIKLTGWFATYENPQDGKIYFAVIVPDATACCQQGLEFVWTGEHSYPSDYPEEGADVTITGRYKLTEEDGITYNYLEASQVEF